MRKIKSVEKDKGMRYCTFCKRQGAKKVPAEWRSQYWGTDSHKTQLACELHKHMIEDGGQTPERKVELDDDHITEADYQTWFYL